MNRLQRKVIWSILYVEIGDGVDFDISMRFSGNA